MPFSPSIVPSGEDRDVYLLLDQFGGQLGRAWREMGEQDTDFETLIRHLLEAQYSNPVRVVAFNTAEGWSRDVSDDVADELRQRCADRGEVPAFLADSWSAMIAVDRCNYRCRWRSDSQFPPDAPICV